MGSIELEGPDTPACPLLGLATDRRSHFMYPHPAHRCFAAQNPATTDARRQAAFCLDPGYAACDRYQAQLRARPSGEGWEPRQGSREPSVPPGSTPASIVAGPGTVIHVLHAGDSLARIAATYGLTVEEIMLANGLTFEDAVAPDTRLVIPIGASAASRPRAGPRQRTGR